MVIQGDSSRLKIIKQIDGCSLGPSDSCDYAEIALDSFLRVLVPRLETKLDVDLSFLKFFRDDGFIVFFGEGATVTKILEILNGERNELKFTTEFCSCRNVWPKVIL